MPGRLRDALASFRRIVLLLLLAVALSAAFVYWQMPPLSTLKPQVESYLKKQLGLSSLDLGELSWYWAGHLWVRSKGISFASPNLKYRDGELSIRIPFLRLLFTDFMPNRIRLHGGSLELQLLQNEAPVAVTIPDSELLLDRVTLDWKIGQQSGHMDYLSFTMDDQRRLALTTPTTTMTGQLDQDMLPLNIELSMLRLDWLPGDMIRADKAPPSLHASLHRIHPTQWSLRCDLAGHPDFVLWPTGQVPVPADRLTIEGTIEASHLDKGLEIRRILLDNIQWRQAENIMQARAAWMDGRLHVSATTTHLAMPLVWRALRPLDDSAAWQRWLSSMHAGLIRHARAEVRLNWPKPWASPPSAADIDAMEFSVQGMVEGADISLGMGGDRLRETQATISLDQQKLHGIIHAAELPQAAGHINGTLDIRWDDLKMDINGTGQVKLTALAEWQQPELLKLATWKVSSSDARFHMLWTATSEHPEAMSLSFRPARPWQLDIKTIPVLIKTGTVDWDLKQGLRARDLAFSTELSQGSLSFHALQTTEKAWRLASLQARFQTDLGHAAQRFEIPMGRPQGQVTTILAIKNDAFDATLDFVHASWSNFLGTKKTAGTPLTFLGHGAIVQQEGAWKLDVKRFRTIENDIMQADGTAELNAQGLVLNARHMQTGAFNGSLLVQAPFGPARWTLDVDARFLDRSALPDRLPRAATSKDWELAARIDRFNWGEASLNGVRLKIDSGTESLGSFRARHVHTSKLDLKNLSCDFTLPGKSMIDVRALKANLSGHQLFLSATLKPAEHGALQWHGFAEVSGDFGRLMVDGGLSRRFMGGKMHALFSGEGIFMRERPWWEGMNGRLRLRVDDGRILEGGPLTRLLALMSLADLPKILFGQRKDLVGPGLMYERLQMEGILSNEHFNIYNLAMRATALDMAGRGSINLANNNIDLLMIVHPLQNLDAILNKIPLLRDLLGDSSHSLFSRVYRMKGPLEEAKVEPAGPKESEMALKKMVQGLFELPEQWFGKSRQEPAR